MPEPERCVTCGKDAVSRCDQCGASLCGSHRVVFESELGTWDRCPTCNLRNRIKDSPVVKWMGVHNEVRLFLRWVWVLVFAVLTVLLIVFGKQVAGPFPVHRERTPRHGEP